MVMKRDVMENWKTNLHRFIAFYATFLIVFIFPLLVHDHVAVSFMDYCGSITTSFVAIVGLMSFLYASTLTENMQTKENRISFLMLPATMIEKFVARVLVVTVGTALGMMAAFLLAELTRLLMMPLFKTLPDEYYSMILPNLWHVLTDALHTQGSFREGTFSYILLWKLQGGAWLLWQHSLFILGGTYWQKRAFLRTMSTIVIATVAGIVVMVHVGDWLGYARLCQFGNWLESVFHSPDCLLSFIGFCLSCLTILNWWLSYRLFARTQVIKRKFRLL